MSASAASTGQSPALVARVNEKKAELENLKELRDLSAAVASQMEALEQKLATLSDGTEAIALVLANWHNVLRAINMASGMPSPLRELFPVEAHRLQRNSQSQVLEIPHPIIALFHRHWCGYQQSMHQIFRRMRMHPLRKSAEKPNSMFSGTSPASRGYDGPSLGSSRPILKRYKMDMIYYHGEADIY